MQKSIKQIKSEIQIMMRFIEQRNPDQAQVQATHMAVGFLMANGDQDQLERAYVDLNKMVSMIEAGVSCGGCSGCGDGVNLLDDDDYIDPDDEEEEEDDESDDDDHN